jgi:hypothetical protein
LCFIPADLDLWKETAPAVKLGACAFEEIARYKKAVGFLEARRLAVNCIRYGKGRKR